MKDAVVINNLRSRGFDFNNIDEMLRYEAVERLPRILDKAPKRITIKKAKDVPVYGCKEEFLITYNSLLSETNGDMFRLDLNGVIKVCDKEIYVILQTLIRQGITYCEQLSNACYELFRVICTHNVDTLTVERVSQLIGQMKGTDYWAGQLLDAIRVCLFGDDPVIRYWTLIAQFSGLYRDCFEKGKDVLHEQCTTEKEVDAFVRKYYKEAKADKEFMRLTYTDGISKPLIAMLYYFKDKDEDALRVEDSGKGW